MISQELEKHIIDMWNQKAKQMDLKKGSKTYFKERIFFMSGALAVMDFGKKETECTPLLYFSLLQNEEFETALEKKKVN